MEIIYSEHAKKRLKQMGITELEVEHVLERPIYVKRSFEERKEAVGVEILDASKVLNKKVLLEAQPAA